MPTKQIHPTQKQNDLGEYVGPLIATYRLNNIQSRQQPSQRKNQYLQNQQFWKPNSSLQKAESEEVENNNTMAEYKVVFYVRDTKNSCGHVSYSALKIDGDDKEITHTSIYSDGINAQINGYTFGSIPVWGKVAKNHHEDLENADHVYTKNISKEEYDLLVSKQNDFADKVTRGDCMYSLLGNSNPIASLSIDLVNNFTKAQAEKLGKSTENTGRLEFTNCTGSTSLLKEVGIFNNKNKIIPSSYPDLLSKQGFDKIEKNDVINQMGGLTKQTNSAINLPDPEDTNFGQFSNF